MQFENILEFERHTKQCNEINNGNHGLKLEHINIKSEIDIDGSSSSGMTQHITIPQSQPQPPMHVPSAILTSVISSSAAVANAHTISTAHVSHHPSAHLQHPQPQHTPPDVALQHQQQHQQQQQQTVHQQQPTPTHQQHPSLQQQHNLPIHLQQQLSHHLISSHLPHQDHGPTELHHQVNFHHPHIPHIPNIPHKILSPLFHIPPFNNNHST